MAVASFTDSSVIEAVIAAVSLDVMAMPAPAPIMTVPTDAVAPLLTLFEATVAPKLKPVALFSVDDALVLVRLSISDRTTAAAAAEISTPSAALIVVSSTDVDDSDSGESLSDDEAQDDDDLEGGEDKFKGIELVAKEIEVEEAQVVAPLSTASTTTKTDKVLVSEERFYSNLKVPEKKVR